MVDFNALLNEKLPSSLNAMNESAETEESCTAAESGTNCAPTECGSPAAFEKDDDDDDDDKNPFMSGDDDLGDDLDDISTSDLEDLGDVTEDDLAALDTDDDDEVELDPEEEKDADQAMAVVATPLLLDDELKEESVYEEFADDFGVMVEEGFLFESDADRYLDVEQNGFMTEARIFAPKTRVQLNEADRRKQLFEVGVQASARAHNDPLYWKLQKCYKLERMIKAKLRQKYRGESLRRVKEYIKRLRASKSKILSAIAKKITGK